MTEFIWSLDGIISFELTLDQYFLCEEEEEDDDDDGDGDGDEEAIVLNCLESYKESFKKVGMKNHEQRKKEIKEK